MILYHVITTYHLLECIVHRLNYHSNEKAVLLFPDFGENKFPQYKKLDVFFDDIVLFPYADINHNKYQKDVVDVVENRLPYSLYDFEKIYVAGAQFYFTYYLNTKSIRYYFFEEAGGNLSKPEDWVMTMNKAQQKNYALKYGMMTGDNENVIKKFCNFSSQAPGFYDPKAENFNVALEIKKLPSDNLKQLLDFFDIPEGISYKKDSIIILTQHFAGLKMMSYEEHLEMYQLVLDYFADKYNLVFKCHPDDVVDYENYFSDALVIREKFPAELLSFISKDTPKAVLAISSTGIHNIKDNYEKCISFDVNFQNRKQYKQLHKYYYTLDIIKNLVSSTIYTIGVSETITKNFCNDMGLTTQPIISSDNFAEMSPHSIVIVDDITGTNIGEKDMKHLLEDFNFTIFFINSKKDYIFADEFIFNPNSNWVIKNIEIKSSVNNAKPASEKVFIYSNNAKIRESVKKMKKTKKLKNSDIQVSLTDSNELNFENEILKGKLESAEERLTYYMNKVQELSEQSELIQ